MDIFGKYIYEQGFPAQESGRWRKHGRGASVKDAPRPCFISLYRFYSMQTPTETRSMREAA